jgi:hypothetical protein
MARPKGKGAKGARGQRSLPHLQAKISDFHTTRERIYNINEYTMIILTLLIIFRYQKVLTR